MNRLIWPNVVNSYSPTGSPVRSCVVASGLSCVHSDCNSHQLYSGMVVHTAFEGHIPDYITSSSGVNIRNLNKLIASSCGKTF